VKATLILFSTAFLLMSAPAFAENNAVGIGQAGASAGAQAGSQSDAVAVGGGNSVANASSDFPKQAPGFAAPGLAASATACLGSVSGGGSVAGFGLGLGATYLARDCEARTVAEQLYRYGYREQAVQLLINEHRMVRRVFSEPTAKFKRCKTCSSPRE
jgi:hypothetical protein